MPRLPASEKRKVLEDVKLHIGSGTSAELSQTVGKEVDKLTPKLYNETVKVLQQTGQDTLTNQQKADIINKVTKGQGQSGGLAPLLLGLLSAAAYKAIDTLIPLAVDFVRSKVIKGKGVTLSGGAVSYAPVDMSGDGIALSGDGMALSGNAPLKKVRSTKPAKARKLVIPQGALPTDTPQVGRGTTLKKKQIEVLPISETQPKMGINSYAI